MTGHHKMLLLSVPSAVDCRREPRPHGKGRGGVQVWPIDRSVATKLWHMACVCERGCSWHYGGRADAQPRGRWRLSRL